MFVAVIIATTFFNIGTVHAATVTEPITFAINVNYATQHPDWQEKAREIIADVNKIFAKTTDIRYEIVSFQTFPINRDASFIQADQSYYAMRQMNGYTLGITVFYFAAMNDAEDATIHAAAGPLMADMLSQPFQNTNEQGHRSLRYAIPVFSSRAPEFLISRFISGKEALATRFPSGQHTYQIQVNKLAHEFGHTFGLGIPEYYVMTEAIDTSGVAPFLPPYFFWKTYGDDLMDRLEPTQLEGRFNEMSSFIINQNAQHHNTLTDQQYYTKQLSSAIQIRVRDEAGHPVPGALVKIFGAKTNCRSCVRDPSQNNLPAPLLETLTTDTNGMATVHSLTNQNLTSDVNETGSQAWMIKMVKV